MRQFEYGDEYFNHYAKLADTPMALRLNKARVDMYNRHAAANESVVDVGIGAGTFIDSAPGLVRGYDVNPRAIAWLQQRDLYCNPYAIHFDMACFWDALEHIANPTQLLANIRRVVLVSLPIFRDALHARLSKHYKPGEHIWYFTDQGIRWFMGLHGFTCVERNDHETLIGREDIASYAFVRQ